MNFDGLKASKFGASLTWVVGDEISTSCYSSLIGIVFFRAVGGHGANICDSVTVRNLVFVDEEDNVGVFDIVGRQSLSQRSKFDSVRGKPSLFVRGVFDYISILELFSRRMVVTAWHSCA